MIKKRLFYVISCYCSLFASDLFSGSGLELYDSSITRTEPKTFAPNPLFYPPARLMNPMASLKNEAFLQNSFHWSYFHNPQEKVGVRNNYGEHPLLDK
jgi:hypothetical protein